jgi:iron(III) transport system ATP-binding protein
LIPVEEKAPAIEIQNVVKRFGAVTALDGVSCEVARGELFFLLGPSGCGKTTLLRILAGLEKPDTGNLLFNGRDVAGLAPHERGAPMVFQNYALWPHLTVGENIAFGLVERRMLRSEITQRLESVMDRVGLKGMADRLPGQLSGGQQQRVVLARALVLNPQVILLDEPLSNLDAKLRAEMREEIERLHATTRITFIYVTHDQVEALTLADRMIVMNQGRVAAMGRPADLYHRPPNLFCAEFLGEANILEGRVVGGDGERVWVETALGSWHALPRGARVGDRVRMVIRPENIGPVSEHETSAPNRFEATIRRVRMNGATLTLLLEAGEHEFRATLLNRPGLELVPGLRRTWTVDPAAAIALPWE